jgi:hypothetical protein
MKKFDAYLSSPSSKNVGFHEMIQLEAGGQQLQ